MAFIKLLGNIIFKEGKTKLSVWTVFLKAWAMDSLSSETLSVRQVPNSVTLKSTLTLQ